MSPKILREGNRNIWAHMVENKTRLKEVYDGYVGWTYLTKMSNHQRTFAMAVMNSFICSML
jgi:hypothetical protein